MSARSSFGASCAFADFDRDGYVDLFVVNYVDARLDNNVFCGDAAAKLRVYCHPLNFAPLASVLYHNNGNGTFTDISQKAGIGQHRGNGLGVVVGDYDDDGWPDIFVANDTTPNFLYHNEGAGVFKEVALASGVAVASDGRPRAGMGTDFGDYDDDGRLDLFVTNHELETHTLFSNLGQGAVRRGDDRERRRRRDVAVRRLRRAVLRLRQRRRPRPRRGQRSRHEQLRPLQAGSKEAQRKLLLRNEGGGRFKEVGRTVRKRLRGRKPSAGRSPSPTSTTTATLDLLVTNNGGPAELLRNERRIRRRRRAAELVGTKSNRGAIGARVRLTAGAATQMREVKAGSSYLGESDLRVHVGLGRATDIEPHRDSLAVGRDDPPERGRQSDRRRSQKARA